MNTTAKFGCANVSMQDTLFEHVKKGDGEYLRSVKRCFICHKATEKGLMDHLETFHPKESLKNLLEMFNKKIDDFELACKELYQIHYFFLQQLRKPNKALTVAQDESYTKMIRRMERLFDAIFRDDEL